MTLPARLSKAQETEQLDGINTRPANGEEKRGRGYGDEDYLFLAQVWKVGSSRPFEGWGGVKQEEVARAIGQARVHGRQEDALPVIYPAQEARDEGMVEQPIILTAQEIADKGLYSEDVLQQLEAVLGKDWSAKFVIDEENPDYYKVESYYTTAPFNVEYSESEVLKNIEEYVGHEYAQALIKSRRLENIYQTALGVDLEEFNEWFYSGDVVGVLDDGTEITEGMVEVDQALLDAGRNAYTEYILKTFGFSDEEITEFYEGTTSEDEGNVWTTFWNAARLGGSEARLAIDLAFTSAWRTYGVSSQGPSSAWQDQSLASVT